MQWYLPVSKKRIRISEIKNSSLFNPLWTNWQKTKYCVAVSRLGKLAIFRDWQRESIIQWNSCKIPLKNLCVHIYNLFIPKFNEVWQLFQLAICFLHHSALEWRNFLVIICMHDACQQVASRIYISTFNF